MPRTLGGGAVAIVGLGMVSSPALAWDRNDVSFRGCSEVWIIVSESDIHSDPPTVADVIVETKDGDLDCRRQYFTPETTTIIPGQFGDAPVLKYDVSDGEKILGVIHYNYSADHGGEGGSIPTLTTRSGGTRTTVRGHPEHRTQWMRRARKTPT